MRRFPAPWTVEKIPGGFKVLDANGQSLAYVYGRETKADDLRVRLGVTNQNTERKMNNGRKLKQTRVVVGARSYTVVHDQEGIIRISYSNAVSGDRPLLRGLKTWNKVVAAFNRQMALGQ